jgi:hypothetical protein
MVWTPVGVLERLTTREPGPVSFPGLKMDCSGFWMLTGVWHEILDFRFIFFINQFFPRAPPLGHFKFLLKIMEIYESKVNPPVSMTLKINEKNLETGSFFIFWWDAVRLQFTFIECFFPWCSLWGGGRLILLQLFLIIVGVVVTGDKLTASIFIMNENPGQGKNTGNI